MTTEWSPIGPLRTGLTVLEASAGTGKTWQISSLVVRLVAEAAIPIDRILVVTFTRAATAELTERVRARLAEALRVCRAGETATDPGDDPVLRHLASRAREDRGIEQRLRLALEAFDQAAISTIHGFCQRTLAENAFESGTPPELDLQTTAEALAEQVAVDRYTATRHGAEDSWAAFLDDACGLSVDGYRLLAKVAAGADGRILPEPGTIDATTPPDKLPEGDPAADLAAQVRAGELRWLIDALAENAAASNLTTFDDLLRRLARGLDPEHTPDADRRAALRAAIRRRYRVALIDEFQDTDAVQWQIFREVFAPALNPSSSAGTPAAETHALYLIGDPKQSIYGFRGANMHVYLAAVNSTGGRRFTLNRNHRSDRPLVHALNTLWAGASEALPETGAFLEADIAFNPVDAAKKVRLVPAAGEGADAPAAATVLEEPRARSAPLHVRWFDAEAVGGDKLQATSARAWLTQRVAADVLNTLNEGWLRDTEGGRRPLHPGDCAVLVRTNAEAIEIRAALWALGLPAIIQASESVFDAPERDLLLCWMQAVADPTDDAAARRLAVSRAYGFDAAFLLALEAESPAEVQAWDAWRYELREAGQRFERRGLMAALRPMLDGYDVLSRMLVMADGERAVTNLLHLAELCHGAWQRERLGLPGLIQWLSAAGDDHGLEPEVHEQRLASDAAAVQILTIHKSKGLQFPVVFVPSLWAGRDGGKDDGKPITVTDPDDVLRLCIDVHPKGHLDRRPRLLENAQATVAENIRLTYVALTRAEHRCVVYWGPVLSNTTKVYARGPLSPLLFPWAPDSEQLTRLGSGEGDEVGPVADADDATDTSGQLRRLTDAIAAAEADDLKADLLERGRSSAWADCIAVTVCAPVAEGLRWVPPAPAAPPSPLVFRTYERGAFDPRWRIHSYTSLTRGHEGTTNLEAAGADHDDVVPDDEAVAASAAGGLDEVPLVRALTPLASFAAGTHAGTFLHRILERADFTGSPGARRASISAVVDDEGPRYGFAPAAFGAELVEGLARALETPLGGPLKSLCLAEVTRADRADELRFHLALGRNDQSRAGDRPSHLTDRPLRDCFEVPERPRPDGLPEAYVADLGALRFGAIAGYLTGAIDLVFRHDGRWFVADYKSNRLHPRTARSLDDHYEAPRLAQEMSKHHYYLQAYLYTVALHRHLSRRQRGYDPERHLGGVCYLFLRGMNGAHGAPLVEGGQSTGCVSFRPDLRVVRALDAHLAGESLDAMPEAGAAQVHP